MSMSGKLHMDTNLFYVFVAQFLSSLDIVIGEAGGIFQLLYRVLTDRSDKDKDIDIDRLASVLSLDIANQ